MVRHASAVARSCGHHLYRAELPEAALAGGFAKGYEVVHIPYTDRLFGLRCEESAAAFEAVAERVVTGGARLSVTLHDVPFGASALDRRRASAYRRVMARATGVVVASRAELARVEALQPRVRSLRVIPLPLTPASEWVPVAPAGSDVAVIGFVHPDRGYEQLIGALPPACGVVAVGRAAEGHEALPAALAARAANRGRSFVLTGYVSERVLAGRLARAAVPVAPNRRVSASSSIATWLAHGRRPLVPVCDYTSELAAQWPGVVTRYDPDRPGELEEAIAYALAEPASTVLDPSVPAGPSIAEVADAYCRHLASCRPPRPVAIGGGRAVVPGNHWELLDGWRAAEPPAVSVVIPYYDGQPQLDLVLSALTLQTHPASRIQLVIADDGSKCPPDTRAAADLEVEVVRQPDLGFRAAAARNLGAARADGEVLAFLDGDTIPEPQYLERLCRLPALLPDALVVGRRRHADFSGWSAADVLGWLGARGRPPCGLPEPRWLIDGYRESRDLQDADARSYRHIISAVAALPRELFADLGGFSPEFTAYGGEDWELAHRAYTAGAVLAHERNAVAWHQGPEWAERQDEASARAQKAAERRLLARLLPDDQARGSGQWMPYPAVTITLPAGDAEAIERTARSAFATGADCGLWLTGEGAGSLARRCADPRIGYGSPPADVAARARVVVELSGPADLSALPHLIREAERCGEVCTPAGTFSSTLALRRALRYAEDLGGAQAARELLFGRRDASFPRPYKDSPSRAGTSNP